jgi:flavorubredoxin
MDHSGCLPDVIEVVKPEKVIASAVGSKTLRELFPLKTEITAVKDGETLSLGNRTLTFMETRMLHWPDSMFAYLNEEELLFSQDGFGMHFASLERFDDQIDPAIRIRNGDHYDHPPHYPWSLSLEKVTARSPQDDARTMGPSGGRHRRRYAGGLRKVKGRRLCDDVAQHRRWPGRSVEVTGGPR